MKPFSDALAIWGNEREMKSMRIGGNESPESMEMKVLDAIQEA
jgi:hypothetical protein